MIDLSLKKDFPFFKNNPGLTYLDSAATTQKPQALLDAYTDYYLNYNANVHRSGHKLGLKASELYEFARARVAKFISANKEEIVFVRNATEAINLLASTLSQSILKPDSLVLTTSLEHHSNLLPWMSLAKQGLCKCDIFSVNKGEEGVLNEEKFANAILEKKPKFVAVTMMSNVTGQVIDLKQIVQACKQVGALIVVDGCQLLPRQKVNILDLDVDFLVFSGHKLYGPMGIGVLYGKNNLLQDLPPFLVGGGMVETVDKRGVTFLTGPNKFEAGTPNVVDAYTFGKVLDYLDAIGWEQIWKHDIELLEYTKKRLVDVKEVKVIGDNENQAGVISFELVNLHPMDVGRILDANNVAIRLGNHCTAILMDDLGLENGVMRVSLGIYNDMVDVDNFIEALKEAISFLTD